MNKVLLGVYTSLGPFFFNSDEERENFISNNQKNYLRSFIKNIPENPFVEYSKKNPAKAVLLAKIFTESDTNDEVQAVKRFVNSFYEHTLIHLELTVHGPLVGFIEDLVYKSDRLGYLNSDGKITKQECWTLRCLARKYLFNEKSEDT